MQLLKTLLIVCRPLSGQYRRRTCAKSACGPACKNLQCSCKIINFITLWHLGNVYAVDSSSLPPTLINPPLSKKRLSPFNLLLLGTDRPMFQKTQFRTESLSLIITVHAWFNSDTVNELLTLCSLLTLQLYTHLKQYAVILFNLVKFENLSRYFP